MPREVEKTGMTVTAAERMERIVFACMLYIGERVDDLRIIKQTLKNGC